MYIHSLNMIGIFRPVCVIHGCHRWWLVRITLSHSSPWCVLYLTHFCPEVPIVAPKAARVNTLLSDGLMLFLFCRWQTHKHSKTTSNTTQSSSAGSVHTKKSKSFLSSQPLAQTDQRWGNIQYSDKITFAITLKMSPKFGINRAKLTEPRRNNRRLDLIRGFELMTGAGEAACQRGDCQSKCTCGCYLTSADLWRQQRWLVIFNCFPPLSGSSYLSEACL